MEAVPSELNLFESAAIQTAIISEYERDINPIATLQPGAPIEFLIRGADNLYLDLNNSKLEIKCKITLANGADLGNNNDVAPVNNLLHSLFSSVEMELCGKTVTDPNQMYPYRAFIGTLLSYNKEVLKTRHYLEGWEKDKPDNAGVSLRRERFANSQVVPLIGRPHLDLFHQEKLIPPKCDVKLRLIPNQNQWMLLTSPNDQEHYRMQIMSASLFVRSKEVSSSMVLAHEQLLQTQNFRFEITSTKMKAHHIPQGTNSIQIDNLFLGEIPDRVVVGFVRDDGASGHYNLNPFNFEHYNINFIVMKVNGEQYPRVPLTPNFATGDYLRAYSYMLESLGDDIGQHMIDLHPNEWLNGFSLFVFKLSSGPISGVRPIQRTGSARLEVKFLQPTPRNIKAIILYEQPGLIEIDKFRNVIIS